MATDASDPRPKSGDLIADALRYWEPRRIAYNAVLAAVVLVHFWRWVVLATGTAFGAGLAHFVSMNLLSLNLNLLFGSLLSSGA